MTKPPHLSDEERATLVAYLDGELDEQSTTAVEAKLSREPHVRAEADMLRRTWDLLDYLPRPLPSPTFTSRTLDRISAPRRAEPRPWLLRRWRSWALGVGWAAAVLAASAAGFAGGKWLPQQPSSPAIVEIPPLEEEEREVLVRDLRVIENKRLLEHVDSLEFIAQLADDPDLFGDENLGS
jgi:anti-sigma factor RsiW